MRWLNCTASLGVLALAAISWAGDASAQRKGGLGAFMEPKESLQYHLDKGLFATGLAPVFPDGVDCLKISSPFGSPTRYDGSPRRNDHYGRHNGMDITLPTGTPLLAIADGRVVHSGTAGMLVGNFVWLHYTPEATGLPVHAFARYQHLDEPTPLKAGDRVAQGQVVGLSGNTGTVGGYYGSEGYPHLHFNVRIGETDSFTIDGAMVVPAADRYLDPMGLYLESAAAPFDNSALRALPDEGKAIAVSIKTTDGRIIRAGGRALWPVACPAR